MKKIIIITICLSASLIANSQSESKDFEPGYLGIINLSYGFGVGDYGGDDFVKFDIINGYQLNPHFSLGFGTGILYDYDWEIILLPLYADFRAYLREFRISPFLGLNVGYSFEIYEGLENAGFLINPFIGIPFKTSDRTAINISAGYFKITDYESAIHIGIGFSF